MPLLHLVLVALIQGITEFLPISSSGHLILLPQLTGIDDQGLAIDVAVHVGTLGAVILYFRKDVLRAIRGLPKAMRGDFTGQDARLAAGLVVATIPVVVAGLLIKLSGADAALRSITIIGWTMLIFGLVLFWADRTGSEAHTEPEWTLAHAFHMGLWQVLALIPGTSRSGITITAARFLGYERHDAARLAMLMSIPTIIASGVLLVPDIAGNAEVLTDAALGAVFAFLAALAALALMMRFLNAVSFTPYVIYRVILGVVLLAIAYT